MNTKNVFMNIKLFLNSLLLLIILFLQAFLYSLIAQQDSCKLSPDVVYFNGTIITMDENYPQAEAIAIKADTIIAVGTNEEILSMISSGCTTKIFDLQNFTMLPGFNDSHSHWLSWRKHICSISGATTYPSLEEIMEMLSLNGWTSISELNFGRPDYAPEHLNNCLDLDSRGKLSVRVNGYWGTFDDVSLIDILADSLRTPSRIYSDRIKAPGVKIYVDDPFGTKDILTQEEVNNLVAKAYTGGWQIAAHAVNESAVEKILTAYENVIGSETNENFRYRIEHAVKVNDNQLTRMKQKGIVASFQLMGPPDWPAQSTFQTYISNTNPEWCLRWSDFAKARAEGLKIVGSTDAPFNDTPCDYSPFRIIYQAVTREGYLDRAHADWELKQRISIEEAIRLLTIDGAYATFEENKKGSLTPGKWADFTIVTEDPLLVAAPEDLLNIQVIKTVVGGRTEYCNSSKYNPLCDETETFNINSALISASNYLPEQPPSYAYDNNLETLWNSGNLPPQWIQLDLLENVKISSIELVVDQWPAGQTVHQIWGKSGNFNDPFSLLHAFIGETKMGDTLSYRLLPETDSLRYIKIFTTQGPSWVSWKEIIINRYGPTSAKFENILPISFAIEQNYPNPFNPSTIINYSIPVQGNVTLKIFDVIGREITTLVNKEQPQGNYNIEFDAHELTNGIYFYRLQAGNFVETKKMILLK